MFQYLFEKFMNHDLFNYFNPHQVGVSESLIRWGGADLPPTCIWLTEGIFIIFLKLGSCLG